MSVLKTGTGATIPKRTRFTIRKPEKEPSGRKMPPLGICILYFPRTYENEFKM
jgi:hypothetical protein